MNKSVHQILSTICYADVFDYPLTRNEIWRFLIGNKIKLSDFNKTIDDLVKQKIIIQKDQYFALFKRNKIFLLRKSRAKFTKNKIRHAQHVANLLKFFPGVWFIGISGAVAMANAPNSDDIDFFIITAPGVIWLTRLLCTILLDIFGLRRKPNDTKFKNKICLNMFLDSSKLRLPKKDQNLYSAHEIVQIKPILNKFHIYEEFIFQNKWLVKYLPHAIKIGKPQKNKLLLNKLYKYLIFIEKICKNIQIFYMRERHTIETINEKMIKFHPSDASIWVMEKYNQLLKRYL